MKKCEWCGGDFVPYKKLPKQRFCNKGCYHKIWYQENKKRILEERKKYYLENIEKIKEKNKKYRQDNKEKLILKNKIYRENNKEKIREYSQRPKSKEKRKVYEKKRSLNPKRIKYNKKYGREYYQKNKEKLDKQNKEWCLKNKEKVKKILKKYRKKRKIRYTKDKEFNIRSRLRNLFNGAIKDYINGGKVKSSKDYGIDYLAIIEHLKPFPEDISKFHIDHSKPLCSFQFMNDDGSINLEEVKKAFAPENHHWLLIKKNLRKGSNYNHREWQKRAKYVEPKKAT